MPFIKPSCVRDLRQRVSLVDVVSRVATLRKAGARFKGLCPFHNEKSPSFHVNPDMGVYKCFGCGKSGDIITFVRETEGLTFNEAIETLGQRFNVPIEYEEGSGPTREERSLRQELFDLHEVAADYFHQRFKAADATGDWMRAYWREKRRFAPELAEEFRIGAAEPQDSGLAALLLKRRFSEEALRQCGLFFLREGALPTLGSMKPRFRGRLMIPIRDHQGRVVAFTARQTDLTPEDDPAREAKYVNSPETPIFTKGNLLFNLDRARAHAAEGHPFVMVEGQLDALRCWSVGLKTAIAPQGTAITDGQLALLRRYHSQVECFFDSDAAGQKAALRLLPLAIKAGIEVTFLRTPSDQKVDPDVLFLNSGLSAYETLKQNAISGIALACSIILPSPKSASPEEKASAVTKLHEIVDNASSLVTIDEYHRQISQHVGISNDARYQEIVKQRARTGTNPLRRLSEDEESRSNLRVDAGLQTSVEADLLTICLHFEDLGKPLSHALPHDWIDTTHAAGALLNRFLAEFEQDAWPGRLNLDPLVESDEEKALIASLLFAPPSMEDPRKVALEGLQRIRTRALEPRLRQIELALATHQTDSTVDAFSLLKERSELQRQLRQPLMLPESV